MMPPCTGPRLGIPRGPLGVRLLQRWRAVISVIAIQMTSALKIATGAMT